MSLIKSSKAMPGENIHDLSYVRLETLQSFLKEEAIFKCDGSFQKLALCMSRLRQKQSGGLRRLPTQTIFPWQKSNQQKMEWERTNGRLLRCACFPCCPRQCGASCRGSPDPTKDPEPSDMNRILCFAAHAAWRS